MMHDAPPGEEAQPQDKEAFWAGGTPWFNALSTIQEGTAILQSYCRDVTQKTLQEQAKSRAGG
jgi:hypothetical protein